MTPKDKMEESLNQIQWTHENIETASSSALQQYAEHLIDLGPTRAL
jgi:hypothetical protein